MNNRLLPFAGLLCLICATSSGEELQPIFNGKNLADWNKVGGAVFEVADSTIVGKTGDGTYGWLCTARTYGDFILELEVNIKSGNSGVQIRSHLPDSKTMVGCQIEVDPTPRAWSGGLYEQGRRGWLQNLTNNPAARAAFKVGEWNKYRIECVGDLIRSWVNGVPAANYRDSMDLDGLIALQVHSGKNCEVRFRNLRLQDLGRHVWKPLWDGKTFSGWHVIGKGDWKIQDGAIHAIHSKEEKEFGHLVSDKTFSDFTARLDYKSLRGNSGFYFRIDEKGTTGVAGFQAEIDATKDAGGLYETDGRAWVSQPSAENVQKWFKPQAWNSMTVSAHGRWLAVDVNGSRSAELRDDPGRLEGHLALQLHGNQDCEVFFKNIEILEKAE